MYSIVEVAPVESSLVGEPQDGEGMTGRGVVRKDPCFQSVEVKVIPSPLDEEVGGGTAVPLSAICWIPDADADLCMAVAPINGVERALANESSAAQDNKVVFVTGGRVGSGGNLPL